MSPPELNDPSLLENFPRVSGDEPPGLGSSIIWPPFSPRERG